MHPQKSLVIKSSQDIRAHLTHFNLILYLQMNSRRKRIQYALGGLSMTVMGTALFMYMKDNSQLDEELIISKIKKVRESISEYFNVNKSEKVRNLFYTNRFKMATMLKNKDTYILMIDDACKELLKAIPQDRTLRKLDKQKNGNKYQPIQLMNIDFVTSFIQNLSFDEFTKKCQDIKFYQCNINLNKLSKDSNFFIKFVYYAFIGIVSDLEILLTMDNYQLVLSQINFFTTCLLDWIQSLLKKNSHLSVLVAIALLQKNSQQIQMLHKCDDMDFTYRVSNINRTCTCTLLDLVIRYSSLFSPKIQLKFYTLILDYQIFSHHIQELTQAIVKNTFYLGCQITVDNILFLSELQPITYLGLLGLAHPQIKNTLPINTILNYIGKLMNSNNIKFWSKSLKGIILLYSYSHLIISDSSFLNGLTEQNLESLVNHFFSQLLLLETYDDYNITQVGYDLQNQIIHCMAQNMDSLLTIELIQLSCYLILKQLIQQLKNNPIFIQLIQSNLIKYYRLAEEKKPYSPLPFELNCTFIKFFAFYTVSQLQLEPNKQNMKVLLYSLSDKVEIKHIFTNALRVLFDLPSTNLHFLRYIQPQCEILAPEANLSFNAYYNNIMHAGSISYDLYLLTLQMSFLFGKCDLLMLEMKPKLLQDLKQLEIYLDFFMRDILLLLDIIENPYYYYNVRSFLYGEHQKQLVQNALISIIQLNGELQQDYLLQTVKKFVHIKDIPQSWILEVLEYKPAKKTYGLQAYCKPKYPLWCLQKDIASANLLLEKSDGDFLFECLDNQYEFLKQIRRRVYLNRNFQSLLEECLLKNPYARMVFFPWIAKFIYYGKEVLDWGRDQQGVNQDCYEALNRLMQNQYIKEFKEELVENKKYLRCKGFIEKLIGNL